MPLLISWMSSHTTHEPVSWRTMSVARKYAMNSPCRIAPRALDARDRRPQRQDDQRHGRREHPDEHLGAVGDRLGEPHA